MRRRLNDVTSSSLHPSMFYVNVLLGGWARAWAKTLRGDMAGVAWLTGRWAGAWAGRFDVEKAFEQAWRRPRRLLLMLFRCRHQRETITIRVLGRRWNAGTWRGRKRQAWAVATTEASFHIIVCGGEEHCSGLARGGTEIAAARSLKWRRPTATLMAGETSVVCGL